MKHLILCTNLEWTEIIWQLLCVYRPMLLTYHRSLSSAGIPNQGRGHALVPAAVMSSSNYYN
jgi:hypothetical protein